MARHLRKLNFLHCSCSQLFPTNSFSRSRKTFFGNKGLFFLSYYELIYICRICSFVRGNLNLREFFRNEFHYFVSIFTFQTKRIGGPGEFDSSHCMWYALQCITLNLYSWTSKKSWLFKRIKKSLLAIKLRMFFQRRWSLNMFTTKRCHCLTRVRLLLCHQHTFPASCDNNF